MTIGLLQHDPDRFARYRALSPFARVSDPELVVVFDPDLIDQIFRSENFRVVDYPAHYRRLTERTGIDLSAITLAFDHIPLAHEGERHRELRAEMARIFGVTAKTGDSRLAIDARRIVDDALKPGATVDLVADIIEPVFDALFEILLGVDRSRLGCGDAASQIFDGSMSLNRRKRLDLALRDMLAGFAEADGDLRASPGLALALNVLGQDALVGSLALSLWRDLGASEDAAFDRVVFSPTPSATSVAYIDRVAAKDTVVGPLAVTEGEIVRLFLDATTIEARGRDGGVLFGKGRHVCLGKPLALAAWRLVTQSMAKSRLTFRRGALDIRKSDHVFIYPSAAVIRLGD